MTSPFSSAPLADRVRRMKRAAIERDARMVEIGMIRKGKPEILFPDLFSDTWRKSVVANFIDSTAREFAEMVAPLPAVNCSSGAMVTEADKHRAAVKNKIAGHYLLISNLAAHMISHCDAYFSYGFAAFVAEPDYKRQLPIIRTLPSVGTYYDLDRDGNTLRIAHCYRESVDKMASLFPEYAGLIRTKVDTFGNRQLVAGDELLEVVWWQDAQQTVLFVPEREGLTLTSYPNATGKCTVRVAERPGLFADPLGQFDDVIWIQLARHRMAMLGLEAGVKAVGAPLAVPRDVAELAVGPDAVMVSETPEKIRRVGIEVPQSTFALTAELEQEQRLAARYPEGRSGNLDASVITGRGVQALMGSFDTQIATAQTVIGAALAKVIEFAFEIDVKVWPDTRKRITGNVAGEAYDFSYTPSKDIGDTYTASVTYGFAAGLSPNAAVVMMLQLRGDGLVDRDTVRRNLPWAIDAEQMQRNLDVEQTADAMKQGLFAYLASIGQLEAAGQDPRALLRTAAEIIKGRQNGKPLADLFIEAFAPEVQNPEAAQAQGQPAPDAAATAGAAPELADVVPGQAGMAPGGLPALQNLIAGLRGGRPTLDATVSRRLPAA